ncbi:hypothetical protein ACQKNC_06395 [Lysinibacillus sp. NPDC094177]|uniref:hypothetical protein n=1 Tax=Lysinibacillus sp. NPDC094177 TaxID=3390580 RepID=UPI003CFF9300
MSRLGKQMFFARKRSDNVTAGCWSQKGLEYQLGSLKLDGVAVTDEQETDKIHFVDG